jgi:voltage-dependent calcium channel T type alpha-1I
MANLVLTCLFGVEMLLKIIGLGLGRYMKDKFNVFDAIVVAMSFVEVGLSGGGLGGSNLSSLRSFRSLRVLKSFRVLRMFKMFRWGGAWCT